jgi:hypothetical protein
MPLILGLSACDSTSTVSRATGIAYEVAVVMNKVAWDSSTGEAVKNELTSPVPYLPQSESSMRITYVRPDQFDGLLKYIRNILIVNIDDKMYTKVSLRKESDKWAMGQAVLYLNAPDGQSIETYLAENPRVFVKQYTEEEMNRTREFLYKNYSPVVMEKVKNKFGIELYAPTDILSYKDSTDCLWFSNDAAVGRTDLLIYSFPYTDNNTFTLEYLVAKRDSITKHMIPGSFAGSYMSVEKRVVDFSPSTLHGKYCGILRGLWRMEGGDMMGGPFVSYACVDEDNRRVIVTEGFVYEPNKEKKNYIRRLEAALQTTRLPANDTADIGRIPESVEKEKKKE